MMSAENETNFALKTPERPVLTILVRQTSWNEFDGLSVDPRIARLKLFDEEDHRRAGINKMHEHLGLPRKFDVEDGAWKKQLDGVDILVFYEDPSGMTQQYGPELKSYIDLVQEALGRRIRVFYRGASVDNRAVLKLILGEELSKRVKIGACGINLHYKKSTGRSPEDSEIRLPDIPE